MKRFFIVAFITLGIVFNTGVNAQGSKTDNDSIECLKNYSLYSLSLKKKMYDYALPPWREMFFNCPDITISIYSDGVTLYKHYIKQEKNPAKIDAYVDSIMMVYDQRIKYYGNHPKYPEGWILGRKAIDLVKYRRGDVESLLEAYGDFERSYELQNLEIEPLVAINWLQTAHALSDAKKISQDEVLDVYFSVDEIISYQLANETDDSRIALLNKLRVSCNDIITKTGLNDCDKLVANLSQRYDVVKDDQAALEGMLKLMNDLECTDNDLFAKITEQNYNLNPSASAAYYLAKVFVRNQQMDKAIEYYNKAIVLEDDKEALAKYYYELAVVVFSYNKDGLQARKYAEKAIENLPTWGKPQILIGNIYAYESKNYGANEFEQQAVYWVALDRYQKAKKIDPDCTEEANRQIEIYSKYIPNKETGFFYGISEGSKYTVGDWINEETTVRYR